MPFIEKKSIDDLLQANLQQRSGFALLNHLSELKTGSGNKVFRVDKQGLRMGNEIFADAPFSVDYDGNAVARSLTIGEKIVYVAAGDSIQTAIDTVNTAGGGSVMLGIGTFTLTASLTGYSKVSIFGVSPLLSIIDCNSGAYSLNYTGTSAYSTGTVAITKGSAALVGTTTLWAANVTTSHKILLQGTWYSITTVTDNTHITLSDVYNGSDLSGSTYVAAITKDSITLKDFTIKNSSTHGIIARYTNRLITENIFSKNNAGNGINISDSSLFYPRLSNFEYNTLNGIYASNVWKAFIKDSGCFGNTDDGMETSGCYNWSLNGVYLDSNGGHGINTVDGSCMAGNACFFGNNTGVGMMIDGCDRISFTTAQFLANGSDGVKFQNDSNYCMVSNCCFVSNGGYGVNVSESDCDANDIRNNRYTGNVSGTFTDSGTGTLKDPVGNFLYKATADVALTNETSTDEQTLLSVSIAGGTLGTTDGIGGKIFINLIDELDAGARTATIRMKYGATTVASFTFVAPGEADATYVGVIDISLFANAATNAQIGAMHGDAATAGFIYFSTTAAEAHWQNVSSGVAAEDSTAAKNLAITVQWSGTALATYQQVVMLKGSHIYKILS